MKRWFWLLVRSLQSLFVQLAQRTLEIAPSQARTRSLAAQTCIPGQINVRAAYANGIIKNLQTLCGDPALPLVRPHITKLTSRTPILIAIAILFIGVFGLDYSAGRELNLWLLYIVPIALGTFAMGPRSGVVMSCLAGALLCLNGYLLRNPYSSDFAFLVDRASDVVAYLLIVSLIGVARGRYQAFKTEVKHAAGLPD